jgi:lysophospholipase L1-like esterase
MRTFAKRLLMAFVGILIALVIAEAALRILGKRYTGSTYTADPVLGWGLRPGASAWEADEGVAWTRINSHGYRDRERTVSKPRGVYRVAVLGDSYTEARQVAMDKTFTALAEEALNRRRCVGEGGVEVLNFGVPGYGTAQELLQLRERVWPFSPDMIVLQFHAGNDMYNNYRALNISGADLSPYFLLKDGRLELDDSFRHGRAFHPAYIRLKRVAADITNSSVVLQVLYKMVRVVAQRRTEARLKANARDTPAPDARTPPPEYPKYLGYLPPAIPSMVEAWRVTEALITEFGDEVRSHHVPLLLLIAPTRHQVHPDPKVHDAYRAQYGIESLEYADDRVDQHARAQGIPVLRLSKPLIEEARRTGAYVAGFANTAPNDGHLNEQGHAVVARELVEAICAMAAAKAKAGAREPAALTGSS